MGREKEVWPHYHVVTTESERTVGGDERAGKNVPDGSVTVQVI